MEKTSKKKLQKIIETNLANKNLIPYINMDYTCKTCGNIGKSHPDTSFCFICDSDNWELTKPIK